MQVLTTGDLCFWLTDDRRPVRARVELITATHVYLKSTADDHGRRRGEVWREARYSRRVTPRDVVHIHKGRVYVDWKSFVVAA